MRLKRPSASAIVLGLLCVLYLITYVDRVNIATAAPLIKRELGLSNTQLGIAFSAFAYTYALMQIFGGWLGDRFGPRSMLFVCGIVMGGATLLTGLSGSLFTLFAFRLLLGVGEGATFPCATRAMQSWMPVERRGFAQGITHAFSRFGNAVTPPIVAFLVALITWRGSFAVLGVASLLWVIAWVWYYRDDPSQHRRITGHELDRLPNRGRPDLAQPVPWRRLVARMLPVTFVYFCYAWTLWLYLNWLPSFFLHEYQLNLARSALFASAVFFAGVAGDLLGGTITDGVFRRTGDVGRARRIVIAAGLGGAFLCMLPLFATRAIVPIALSLAAALFCLELVIGPIWSMPMDIGGPHAGTAGGIMNTGSAVAAILSPLAFGVIADVTGNWHLPFLLSMALLVLGAWLAYTLEPDAPAPTYTPAIEPIEG